MATIRRIAKRRREEGLNPSQRGQLLTGWHAVGLSGEYTWFKTLEEFTAAWNEYRAELLPDFIERHPGHRPLAWWIVDHRKSRPMNDAGVAWVAKFGDHLRGGDKFRETFGFLHSEQWQVDETEYLRENGLLVPGEAVAIERKQAAEAERERLWEAGAAERRASVAWMYAENQTEAYRAMRHRPQPDADVAQGKD